MKKYGIMLFVLILGIIASTGCGKNYIHEISYKEYQELIRNKETFVLEVMKNDCVACRGIRPKLQKITKKYKVEVKFIDLKKLSQEENDSLAVSATPTIIFYTNGEEETTTARIEGNVSEKRIIEKFKASSFIK